MTRLIITADDFGLAPEVNDAVAQAHTRGVLACASLMITAPAAAEAVALAKATPSLRVGLHVAVVQAPSALDGRPLPRALLGPSLRWAALPDARRRLRAEIDAQFAAFAATGLPLDHVNSHNHMHMHPVVLDAILDAASRHGRPPLRLPREPKALDPDRRGSPLLRRWADAMGRRMTARGFATNDWIGGLSANGRMTERMVLRLLDRLPSGVTELYFHPATAMSPALRREWHDMDGPRELAALTSPKVADRLQRLGLRPGGYRDALANLA